MRKRFVFILCMLVGGSVFSQDLSTFQTRRYWLLTNLHDVQLKGSGKHTLVKACARLWNNPTDTVGLNYITYELGHPHQTMFDFPGIALGLGMFWDSFSQAQLDTIQSYLEICAKPDKIGKGRIPWTWNREPCQHDVDKRLPVRSMVSGSKMEEWDDQ